MYAGTESAWHLLGIVDPTLTRAVDAISVGGMDYQIHKFPLSATTDDGTVIPFDQYGLVRGHTTHDPRYVSLGTCGKDYDFWQNSEIADRIDMLSDETGWKFSTAGVLGKGETLFICLKVKTWDVRGDPLDRFFAYNEFRDGKRSACVTISNVRTVCKNTQDIAIKTASSRINVNHRGSYKLDADWIMSMIGEAEKAGMNIDMAMNALADITINDDQFSAMLDTVMPLPTMPRILTMPNLTGRMKDKQTQAEYIYTQKVNKVNVGRNAMVANWVASDDIPSNLQGTGWAAYQAVTQYTSHQHGTFGARGKKMTDANRAEWDLFGDGVTMRNAAYVALTSGDLF
jgi:phage/plasmid-like protein (TIGR03299 family)